ncbi:MAG: DNA alkylation repair protein, partial [Pontibacterium sp.]
MAQALKDVYNRAYLEHLAQAFVAVHPAFPADAFVHNVLDKHWPERELKARTQHIRHCLHQSLALPYEKATAVLMEVAPGFSGYEAMFFPDFVDAYGRQHWEASMEALQVLTRYSSSEFAVRPFIEQDQPRMMAQMLSWSEHENYHVRRLASEGCRPRLPWASALPLFKQNPAPILPILNNLRCDETDYVRRSVANNLNDIAKDNPQITLDWAKRYGGSHKHSDWIIKHGCRTLLKQAHPGVMAFFGYHPAAEVEVKGLAMVTKK